MTRAELIVNGLRAEADAFFEMTAIRLEEFILPSPVLRLLQRDLLAGPMCPLQPGADGSQQWYLFGIPVLVRELVRNHGTGPAWRLADEWS